MSCQNETIGPSHHLQRGLEVEELPQAATVIQWPYPRLLLDESRPGQLQYSRYLPKPEIVFRNHRFATVRTQSNQPEQGKRSTRICHPWE